MSTETLDRAPGQIEAEISATRQSLDRKLHELEKRLSPRHRWAELRSTAEQSLSSTPVAAWGAIMAVVAGGWMALSGVRRYRSASVDDDPEVDVVVTGVTICE